MEFEIRAPDFDEAPMDAPAEQVVIARALGKARSVAATDGSARVLGADTEVVLDGEVLGQPGDADAAARMLERLAGREHRVLSAVAVIDDRGERCAVAASVVRIRPLDARAIEAYVARGEWRGRAGGYAIQEGGGGLVAGVDGDLDTVIGLPMALVRDLLGDEEPQAAGGKAAGA